MESVLELPGHQKVLSSRLEDHQFRLLFQSLSLPNRARLLSASSPHASAWLQVVPAPGLNLHLDPSEFQAGIKWWLGTDSSQSQGANCPFCSSQYCLDPLGHHALTCKYRGDVVSRHNRLRDVFLESCRRACIGARVEAGSGLGHDQRHTRPADVLVPDWMLGKSAAFDITVTSPLNPSTFTEASVTAGSEALAAELRKHYANDVKCSKLGWKCVPLAVESYGCYFEYVLLKIYYISLLNRTID